MVDDRPIGRFSSQTTSHRLYTAKGFLALASRPVPVPCSLSPFRCFPGRCHTLCLCDQEVSHFVYSTPHAEARSSQTNSPLPCFTAQRRGQSPHEAVPPVCETFACGGSDEKSFSLYTRWAFCRPTEVNSSRDSACPTRIRPPHLIVNAGNMGCQAALVTSQSQARLKPPAKLSPNRTC